MKKSKLFKILRAIFIVLALISLFLVSIVGKKQDPIFITLFFIFCALAGVSFYLLYKEQMVEKKKREEESKRILEENDINSFPISVQFREKFGIGFLTFINKIKDEMEQNEKQKNNGVSHPDVILELYSKSNTKWCFHDLTIGSKKHFYLHPAIYNESKEKTTVSSLIDIIHNGWTEEKLEVYKNASIEDFEKIIHKYDEIAFIDYEIIKYKEAIGRTMVYMDKHKIAATISFAKEAGLPQLRYVILQVTNPNEYYNYFSGFINAKIFEKILKDDRLKSAFELSGKRENIEVKFNKGKMTRTEYEKTINDIKVGLEFLREQKENLNNNIEKDSLSEKIEKIYKDIVSKQ